MTCAQPEPPSKIGDQLALSTRFGFASAGPGNAISETAQENKLRLVGEVAHRVWG